MTVFSQRWIAAAAMACTLWGCDGGSDSATGVTNTGANVAANRSQIGGNGSGSNLPAASWTSVKWGGGGYVTGLIYHPSTRACCTHVRRWRRVPLERDQLDVDAHHRRHRFRLGRGRFPRRRKPRARPEQRSARLHGDRHYRDAGSQRPHLHLEQPRRHLDALRPAVPGGRQRQRRATSERLQVDPNNPSTLFYGSRTAGLWKSADSGRTWTQVTGLSSTTISGGSSPIGVEQVIFDTSGKGVASRPGSCGPPSPRITPTRRA